MESEDQFYITLPSNSSMKYFPFNKTTNFTTQLPRPINLQGKWVMALVELHYPQTILPVKRCVVEIITTDPKTKKKAVSNSVEVPPGNYDNMNDIIRTINSNNHEKHVMFGIDPERKYVAAEFFCTKFSCSPSTIHKVIFPNKLAYQLGYNKAENDLLKDNAYAPNPFSIAQGLPSQLFVYCNIIEAHITGDIQAQLLRVVQCETKNYSFGSTQVNTFSMLQYFPIINNNFQTIEIDIRDDTGEPIIFEYGTLTATLHFKRLM